MDLSGIDRSEITGKVGRKAQDIANWIREDEGDPVAWPVIVSTYQSGHTLADGVRHAGADAAILICDEAHRTAGLKRTPKANEATLRNFTVCHDNALLPARNRLYMTATPKTVTRGTADASDDGYVVVPMNDEATFGPNLHEIQYREAVERDALTDYRIAAIVPHNESYEFADRRARKHARAAKNKEAQGPSSKKGGDRSTSLLVRQIAYGTVLAGGIETGGNDGEKLAVPSSIAFCNRTKTSSEMADELNDPVVRKHIAAVTGQGPDGPAKRYEVHHREAKSRAGARHEALTKLAAADPENPVGISNVGIFGEGIDTPDLAAIAFIQPRKGQIDVIQAVGRVMRRSKAKEIGLILVPLEIPPDEDAEAWLESRTSANQFKELGQILLALRAHDGRIEDRLEKLLRIYEPTGNRRAEKTGAHVLTTLEPEGPRTYVVTGRDGVINDALVEANRKKTVLQLLEATADKVKEVSRTEGDESLPGKPRSTWVADCRKRSKPRIAPVDVNVAHVRRESDDRYPLTPIADAQRTLLTRAIVDKRKGLNKNTVDLRPPVRRDRGRGSDNGRGSYSLLGCILENNERGRAIRMRILRGLIGPIEEAVTARRPLLIRTDAETGGQPGVPGLAAAKLANLISPGMTPDEQQRVLETYDLAGITPPGGTPATPGPDRRRRPIPRPLRYPHSTATAGALGSMDRAIFPSRWNGRRRPGEVDLAAHGVLVVEVDEDMRLDRDAADAVRDDVEHRAEHGYTLLAVGDPAWMNKTGGYPLRDVFEFTADWTGKRAPVDIVDPARHREEELALIEDARRRVTEAWS